MANVVVPEYDVDLFSDEEVMNSDAHFAQLRELGEVVWLNASGVYAMTSYAAVRAALSDADTFVSGEGVGFNDIANTVLRGTTLASDDPEHKMLRAAVAAQLIPSGLKPREESIIEAGRRVVRAALESGEFDSLTAISQAMPLQVVPDFIGLPDRNRDKLFEWSIAGIDLLGPDTNPRIPVDVPSSMAMGEFAGELVAAAEFTPGSMGAGVMQAAARGDIPAEKCPILMLDYLGPSLETTASALSHFIVLMARNPQQWQILKKNPGLVTAALNETLRIQAPLRGFSRVASRDTEVAGTTISAGSRVWALLSSANRDRAKWGDDADEFKIERNPTDHLAFGYGAHGCAGQGLAKMEIHSVIHAMLDMVDHIELTGEPVWHLNTMANNYESIPARFVPAT